MLPSLCADSIVKVRVKVRVGRTAHNVQPRCKGGCKLSQVLAAILYGKSLAPWPLGELVPGLSLPHAQQGGVPSTVGLNDLTGFEVLLKI